MTNQAAQTMPELPPSFARVHNDGYWTLRVRDTAEFIVHDSRQTPAQEVYSSDQMRDMYQQGYAAALSKTAGVPEGWKLVPVEPTDAMMEAAMQREDDEPLSSWGKIVPAPHEAIYCAMLAAAPAASGAHTDALPDGTLSKSTAKRVTALAAAPVSERAREWEEWNDGDSSFLSVADSDARYEVSFAIHEGHSGVWRAYFNPDTEREPIKETHLGTFASKERAKKECEDHCNRAGNYRDNDGGVPYVY